jgi:6-phosphogluconolactonase (cycloisomerase 2 family)
MRDRRLRLGWLVGFVVLAAVPRAGEGRITFVQEEGIEDGHFEYQFVGDVVVSPDDRHLYATQAYSPNRVLVYEIAPGTGKIEEVQLVDPLTVETTILAISPDGDHLYGLDYSTGEVTTFARDAGTGLLTRLGVIQPPTSGINQQWQGLTVSPDGAHVYATSFGRNSIGVYARDPISGLLSLVDVQTDMPGLVWPIGIDVSPDGAHVYVACYRPSGGLVVLARDAVTGLLSAVEHFENGTGGYALSNQFAIDVAPDGGHVYVSGGQGIVVYARNVATGTLTRVHNTIDASDHEVIVSADGTRVYACGSSQGVRGYARNAVTGSITSDELHQPGEEGFAPPLFCFGMAMTSQGRHHYAITTYDLDLPNLPYAYTIGVFRRLNVSCSAAPLTGCETPIGPGTASLKMRKGTTGRLSWKLRGTGSSAGFGNPLTGATDVAMCVYDDRGRVVESIAPGSAPCPNDRSCWAMRSATDVRYKNSKTQRDGLRLVKLQQRQPGDLRLGVEANGWGLLLPTFPMVGPVTVQLQLSDGTTSSCWTSTYSTPSRNDGVLYRATSDP